MDLSGSSIPLFDTVGIGSFHRYFSDTSSSVDSSTDSLISLSATDTIDNSFEPLTEAAELVELMGLSAEESGKLAQISKLNGKEFRTQNTAIFNQLANFNKLNKTVITGKALMQDISKLSNTVLVNFKGNERSMVEATAAAKKFGLELAQVDKIADSLLDFESSISNELSAELITGKQLNLEQARLYALNNDMAGLSRELAKNFGTAADFSKMNRIQQDSIASAMGMSRDQMAEMLKQQELFTKLGSKQGDTAKEQLRLGLERYKNQKDEKIKCKYCEKEYNKFNFFEKSLDLDFQFVAASSESIHFVQYFL